eukprot:1151760-Pelagomonas_calceolata.AAC.8
MLSITVHQRVREGNLTRVAQASHRRLFYSMRFIGSSGSAGGSNLAVIHFSLKKGRFPGVESDRLIFFGLGRSPFLLNADPECISGPLSLSLVDRHPFQSCSWVGPWGFLWQMRSKPFQTSRMVAMCNVFLNGDARRAVCGLQPVVVVWLSRCAWAYAAQFLPDDYAAIQFSIALSIRVYGEN